MSIARQSSSFSFVAGAIGSLCVAAVVSLGASGASGCGSSGDNNADAGYQLDDGSPGLFSQTSDDGGGDGAANLPRCIVATKQCVASCPGGGSTTVSGTVYDPAGKNPLYGIVVYVPSVPPAALPVGAGCYSCADLYQSGMPIAYSVTDSAGKFTLTGVPDGTDIPLVVQVGKWRMQYKLPSVAKCTDNPAAAAAATIAAPAVLRLPKNHTEGDLPNVAIATGAADSLECLLSRIGVDKAEYGPGAAGAGRLHIFQGYAGNGSNTMPAAPLAPDALWKSQASLMPFDLTLLTCEGAETTNMNQDALYAYAQAGGRVFASHFHYSWFNTGPFAAHNLAQWFRNSNQIGNINAIVQQTLPGGAAFPRGVAMQQWLTNVGALTAGELPIQQARRNAWVTAANTASLPWIVADSKAPAETTEYFSFDTPFGVASAEQCGRVVYSDLHVGAASGDYGGDNGDMIPANSVVPTGCANNALSPQEKALEFMLFDLSGCITPPDQGAGGIPITAK
jgi:hypothetical protein